MMNAPHTPQRIVLTGFMGCGKTTVGRLLAEQLGWHFTDLDDAVAAWVEVSVPAILATFGEPSFRQMEADVLERLLQERDIVISLGGGAPETPEVRALLACTPSTAVLHLQAPFPLLFERCTAQAMEPGSTPRPLLGATQETELRYMRRQSFYAAVANHTIDAALSSPHDVAAAILQRLRL